MTGPAADPADPADPFAAHRARWATLPRHQRLTEQADALRTLAQRHLPPTTAAEARWRILARPSQIAPDGPWAAWALIAGRGAGKSRTGAEWVRQKAATPNQRIAVVARTTKDARDTCVEGDSGLLNVIPATSIKKWNRSFGELDLANGTHIKCFTAEEPDSLRGPQHHWAWADELAAWPDPDAWDQLIFGLRLGVAPQVVITTTPRPRPLIRELLARPDVHVTRGTIWDNADHLAPAALAGFLRRYQGTRLGRQELEGELLEDRVGALFTLALIDAARVAEAPDLARVVVAVDPAVTDREDSAETGVVTAALGVDGHGYVLADDTIRGTPEQAMRRVAVTYHAHQANIVVVEKNNGGDYLPALLHTIDPHIPVRTVTATRGKALRAEPVSALYEQGRIHHVGGFVDLETQMTQWAPEDPASPDRLDALVWAFYDLVVDAHPTETYFAALAPPCPKCHTPTKPSAPCPKCATITTAA